VGIGIHSLAEGKRAKDKLVIAPRAGHIDEKDVCLVGSDSRILCFFLLYANANHSESSVAAEAYGVGDGSLVH
jgi:hypothetical protein